MTAQDPPALLGQARAFVEARILLTGTELGVFDVLAVECLGVDEIARRLSLDTRAATILLDALVAMGHLLKRDSLYANAPHAQRFLASGSPASVAPMLLHQSNLWPRWTRLTEVVRNGVPDVEDASPAADGDLRAFIGAMHVVGSQQASSTAAQMRLGDAKALLDVGGASGTYVLACLRESPGLRATLFDRPAVIEMARERLHREGALDRVTLVAGDFYMDELPGGHDLVLLSAIIHQNSRAQNVALYRKCYGALVPGGRLVIRDHVMSPERTLPAAGAIFAVNMLVATPGGGTYTLAEIREDLQAAGLERVAQIHEGDVMDALVEAYRPL
ncbi:MAG TPA: methyltransferase [Chthonomonadales bacterium]|nr:methyltransferase [Chthonomonadales bacterium]